MKLSDFDYQLPKELIAQYPAEKRDESRLLVLHRDTGRIDHRVFKDIVEYLHKDDLLVLNNTKVIPSRLFGKKHTGGKVEVLVLKSQRVRESESQSGDEYEVLLKPARGCRAGAKLVFADGKLKAEVARIKNGRRFLRFYCYGRLDKLLDEYGSMPLPPYIKRQDNGRDRDRYQTVYACKKGAVAAPTAGLHWTKDVLSVVSKMGVDIEYVTLHVGYGTFKPVQCDNIKEHKTEQEYFEISKKAIGKLNSHKGKVIAVGTTTCRVLEAPELSLSKGWTDLFIYPPYKFKRVDALLTNFHLPKTTLLMLVSAFCGKELLFKTYEEAIKNKYRFYSYGDAMLVV